MQEYYILDTETAGLKGPVVELAFLVVDKDLNVKREFCERFNPGVPIEPGASAIHGIYDTDVADCRSIQDAIAEMELEPISVVCHNAPFDVRMIQDDLPVVRSLCTLALSRQYVKGTTNHKLETLKKELNFSEQTSHSALGDVYTVLDLLKYILPMTSLDLETLFERGSKPRMLSHMYFGEHKGKPMLKVPKQYRDWLLSRAELDKDLRYTLERLKDL